MGDDFGNLLRQIDSLAPKSRGVDFLDNRAQNAFAAVQKLIQLIERNYPDHSEDLIKRFFNAAKTNDYRKFERGIERIKRTKA